MEDLLDLVLVIAVAVIGAIAKSNKNKKKKAADKPAQVSEPLAEPAKPVTETIASASDRKMINRRNVENAVKAFSELAESMEKPKTAKQPTAKKAAVKAVPAQKKRAQTSIEAEATLKERAGIIQERILASLSGESPADEHGCIGGSMPDHQAEGEGLREHAAHERERQQRLAEEIPVRAESLRRPTAKDLRRAVVMSEILEKPVSLRGRRI